MPRLQFRRNRKERGSNDNGDLAFLTCPSVIEEEASLAVSSKSLVLPDEHSGAVHGVFLQYDSCPAYAHGDASQQCDGLCEVETDKATVDFENQEDGFIAAILLWITCCC